jgi:trehalose 6-phosphate phosphatase
VVDESRPSASVLAPFVERPDRAAVVLDFDGTLSPIVDTPADARLLAGAAEVLTALTRRYAVVAVVSGRPVSFLEPLLPAGMVISGLYGLESVREDAYADLPGAGAWREAVEDVVRCSQDRGPSGMVVESKGLSLTLHYRGHSDLEPAVAEWAATQAARSGLVVRPARSSLELHPPIAADKGTVVEGLVADTGSVCFVGDDYGDLPAFDALDRLEARGLHVLRVGVASPEAPEELTQRADLVVDGPDGVLDFLRQLVPTPDADRSRDQPEAMTNGAAGSRQ